MMTRAASEVFAAVKKGDHAAVERLIRADPALLDFRENGVTPLLTAYYYGQNEVAERLRALRSPVDIFEAAAAGDAVRVRELIARDPGSVNAYAEDGFQPLGLAAFFKRPDVVRVRLLLEKGADASAANDEGKTALVIASERGHRGALELLQQSGARA